MAGRHSPWFVVAVAALVVALAGTAIAGPSAISDKLTKSSVKKIAKKQIAKAASGLSVAHAKTADTAARADEATHAGLADNALNAANATNANSALNATNAVNATNATNAQNAVAAQSVDGYSFKPIYFAATANGESATILDLEGLTLKASCFVSAPNVVSLTARTAVDNSSLTATNYVPADPQTTTIGNFDSGSDQMVFGAATQFNSNVSLQYATPATAGQARGAIVSASFQILGNVAGAPLGGTKTCLVSGTATGIPAG